MENKLTIQTFGGLKILHGNDVVSGLASRKAEALFIYLACNPRPHPRDMLATLLWDNTPQNRALGNLSVLLTSLRKQLAPFLVTSRYEIGINQEADIELDSISFTHQLTTIRQQYPVLETIPQATVIQLAQTVNLYHGDFLAGFYIRQAAEFEEWTLLEQERFQRLAVESLDTLVSIYLRQAQYSEGITQANRLIQLDPLREQSHCHLMRLLAMSGQRQAALAHYNSVVEILDREFGVEPMERTVSLYHQIKDGKLVPDSSTHPQISPKLKLPLHNLPKQASLFVGRERELKQISEHLNNLECRMLTLVGPGGIGKTRLAIQATTPLVTDYLDGVWFISLAGLSDSDALLSLTADTLGFHFSGSDNLETQLLNYLRQKEMLLIFDNFEHLLEDAVPLLVSILEKTSDIRLLITSREPLNLGAEWLLNIEGLTYPDDLQMQSAKSQRYSAVDLFVRSSLQIKPGVVFKEEEETAVYSICKLVQGMPLGIKMAAAWVKILSPSEILVEIQQNLDFLTSNQRDLPVRQQSIRAIYDASWNHLSKQEQALFPQLAIFWGSFSYDAVSKITGASLVDLRGFMNKSLLQRNENGRFEMHTLLRQYTLDYLEKNKAKAEEVRERHAVYYADWLGEQYHAFYGPHQQEIASEIEIDSENLRTAWHWAVDHLRFDLLQKMMDVLGSFLEWRGHFQTGVKLCQHLTAKGLNKDTPFKSMPLFEVTNWPLFCKILTWEGVFNLYLVNNELAENQIEYSIKVLTNPQLELIDTHYEQAFVLFCYGRHLVEMKDEYTNGKSMLEQSLALSQALDDEIGMARTLIVLSGTYYQNGDYKKGQDLINEALSIQQMLGHKRGIAHSIVMQGVFSIFEGDLETAETSLKEGLAMMRQFNDQYDMAIILNNLGVCQMFNGKFEEAIERWEEAKTISVRIGSQDETIHYETNIGLSNMFNGRYGVANSHAEKLLNSAEKIGYDRVLGTGRILLGGIKLAEKNYLGAYAELTEAEAVYRRIVQQDELAMVLGMNALVTRDLERQTESIKLCSEAIDILLITGPFGPQITAVLAWALLLNDIGKPDEAMVLFELVGKRPFVSKSKWFADIATDELASIQSKPSSSSSLSITQHSDSHTLLQHIANEWQSFITPK